MCCVPERCSEGDLWLEEEGVGASWSPRHIAIAAFHPGHDFYRGGALLERNIAVWCMAGKLLMRFDERAREDMEIGGDEGLSQALAEEIVSAATNLKVAAAEEAESCATEVAVCMYISRGSLLSRL